MNLPTAPRDARDGRGEGRNSLLSERETEVLAYVAARIFQPGNRPRAGARLGRSIPTSTILWQAGVEQPDAAAARAREMGLLDSAIGPWAGVALPSEVSPNPFKGLRAFQEKDAQDFFGREALGDRLLTRLREPGSPGRFLAVIGASGSGKSSLVNAGLIPALRRDSIPGSGRWWSRTVPRTIRR
jgi:hypothetical protein